MSYRLGVDVGGTFTDILLFDEETGLISLTKVPTTVENQAEGIINGIKKICNQTGIEPGQIGFIMHGTTAATNAVLEGKGVETALLVTKGFRDVLHIMRQDRPKLYDFFARRPDPLVPRNLRFEITERILFTGEIKEKLNEEELLQLIVTLKKRKVKSIAVCLLHSYVNPVHEKKIREIILCEYPGIPISISSEILPEIKEYERMSTTVINAYVYPIIDNYLKKLAAELAQIGINKRVHVMQSNGGIMASSQAGKKSVCTILSGPAAGTIGGVALARQIGVQNVITVDMGGTSFDICLASRGKPRFTHEGEIGGHALKVPMIDMHTIGAGGGSIAWIDSGGILKVGPESAGSTPGPVCYGRGGIEPTVTDANLILGRLNKEYLLGGEMTVYPDAAYRAINKKIAEPLGLDTMEVAEGIIKIINTEMVKGIRYVSVEKGYDPREFALVCFGGNGPLHAVELAEELDISKIIVPFAPGVNSAYGLLMADFRYDYMQTYISEFSEENITEINKIFESLKEKAIEQMTNDGVKEDNIVLKPSLDMRYMGQGYELEVPIKILKIDREKLEWIKDSFHAIHDRQYGFNKREETIEVINLRIACFGIMPKPEIKKENKTEKNPHGALKGKRMVYLRGRAVETSIYNRDFLLPGMKIEGPAIIEQKDSTTLLFPENQAIVDEYRNILIKL